MSAEKEAAARPQQNPRAAAEEPFEAEELADDAVEG